MDIFYFTIILGALFWIYKKFLTPNDDLTSQGIAHDKPLPIVGNVLQLILQRQGFAAFSEELYQKFAKNKIYAFYTLFGDYTLMLSDPYLIKQVLVKDFDHFVNRDPKEQDYTDRLMSKSILMMRDDKWKEMRATLSPVYTTSKLKTLFVLLQECIDDFISFYEEKALRDKGSIEIETHDVFARVTADGIATTALGFKGDCVKNPKSKIFEIAAALESDFVNPTTAFFVNTAPILFRIFGFQVFRKSVHDFFETNVLGEMRRRRELNIYRPDVIQMLIQAQDGKLKVEEGDEVDGSYVNTKARKISKWTDEELAAQALVLFLGGFETTASLMQVCCWELARNPEVQRKLIEEVDETLSALGGKVISYETLGKLKYHEMVLNETLRKWPSFRVTPRYCESDYVLKGEDGKSYKIRKGTDITIPLGAIQRDSRFFTNPEQFEPDRFSDENKGKIQSGTFFPFGMGPRVCIGSRFAMLEAKLLLFSVMAKFRIEKCDRTPDTLTYSSGTLGYNEVIYLSLKLRK